jgi:preprotein translocase subunit SecD
MVIRALRFNIYLLLIAVLVLSNGCGTFSSKNKIHVATLRVHLESPRDPSGMTETISLLRNAPVQITIEKNPFLNEAHIEQARVLEAGDEFILSIKLNQQGQRLLEQYTSTNPQRRLAIRSQFRIGEQVYDRWLAAPLVTRRISEGVLNFSPDADRAETDELVKGLNKAADFKEPKPPKVKKVEAKTTDGGVK